MEEFLKRMLSMIQRYKYVAVILLLGVALMLLPTGQKDSQPEQQIHNPQVPGMQEQLEQILSQIQGVGKVRVLLTELQGEQTLYVRDENAYDSADRTEVQSEAVIITDSQRNEAGLIRQLIPPVYQGAVIVCQGGDSAAVRLAVVQAVSDATGLSADKITVLKMK